MQQTVTFITIMITPDTNKGISSKMNSRDAPNPKNTICTRKIWYEADPIFPISFAGVNRERTL